jgi:hypothetical protein
LVPRYRSEGHAVIACIPAKPSPTAAVRNPSSRACAAIEINFVLSKPQCQPPRAPASTTLAARPSQPILQRRLMTRRASWTGRPRAEIRRASIDPRHCGSRGSRQRYRAGGADGSGEGAIEVSRTPQVARLSRRMVRSACFGSRCIGNGCQSTAIRSNQPVGGGTILRGWIPTYESPNGPTHNSRTWRKVMMEVSKADGNGLRQYFDAMQLCVLGAGVLYAHTTFLCI